MNVELDPNERVIELGNEALERSRQRDLEIERLLDCVPDEPDAFATLTRARARFWNCLSACLVAAVVLTACFGLWILCLVPSNRR